MAKKPKKSTNLPRGINLTANGQTYRARIFHNGKRHTLGTFFETIGDAEAALSIARSDIARGVFVPPSERKAQAKQAEQSQARSAITVDELSEQFFTFMETVGRGRGTIYTYKSRYRSHAKETLGPLPVVDVTTKTIDDWHAALVKNHGRGVSRQVYLTVAAMFNYAAGKARDQHASFVPIIERSPCQVAGATKTTTKSHSDEPVATVDQLAFVADNMPDHYRLAVLLSGWCAIRLGELLGLQRHDFETVNGQMWVRVDRQVQARGKGLYEDTPKSEAGRRSVPVPKALWSVVEDHLADHVGKAKKSLVFPRTSKGTVWTHPNVLRNAFNRSRDEWNRVNPDDVLENFTFHGLRHTALTRVGQAGATLEELKRYAGHSSAEVVSKYQHATKDRLAMLAQALSDQM